MAEEKPPKQVVTTYVQPDVKARLATQAEANFRSMAAEVEAIIADHFARMDASKNGKRDKQPA